MANNVQSQGPTNQGQAQGARGTPIFNDKEDKKSQTDQAKTGQGQASAGRDGGRQQRQGTQTSGMNEAAKKDDGDCGCPGKPGDSAGARSKGAQTNEDMPDAMGQRNSSEIDGSRDPR